MGRKWNLNEAATEDEQEEKKGGVARTEGSVGAENDHSVSSDVVVEVSDEGEPVHGDTKIFGFSISGRRDEIPSTDVVTHQFFPEGDVDGMALEPVVTERATEESQAAKKSRRGPRSRSSQFRGVTFYRRTGRWESHIWLAPSSSSLPRKLRKDPNFGTGFTTMCDSIWFLCAGTAGNKFIWVCGFDTARAAARFDPTQLHSTPFVWSSSCSILHLRLRDVDAGPTTELRSSSVD
ncbi:hypothetical protein BHM03_00021329 [Ensete ventricosum]|nr:hypothetical protein BHM03_00021329 [Ensete ventricosum]